MNAFRALTITAAATTAFALAPLSLAVADSSANDRDPVMQLAQADQAPAVPDETLDKFVDALVDVQAIRDEVATELQTVESETAAQALREQAQNQMVTAVEGRGISVQEYNKIAVMMQQNPEFAQQVQEMAAERM